MPQLSLILLWGTKLSLRSCTLFCRMWSFETLLYSTQYTLFSLACSPPILLKSKLAIIPNIVRAINQQLELANYGAFVTRPSLRPNWKINLNFQFCLTALVTIAWIMSCQRIRWKLENHLRSFKLWNIVILMIWHFETLLWWWFDILKHCYFDDLTLAQASPLSLTRSVREILKYCYFVTLEFETFAIWLFWK